MPGAEPMPLAAVYDKVVGAAFVAPQTQRY
ncbi:hypothetical protein LBM341_00194 [Ralstonia solanacearum]|uniref:Uncharacterized protein n=1 Tax=Ralstonia solanacearum TaxID=305 RepID=A0A0S4UQ91_RALSL|nr:hypothetical protein LBM341_00194 [Ralstonia solanacearum]NKA14516.1 hypothetical protein [Ralstonia solanacearum]NKA49718.1 hypothetical protein [Ralstonia solanacearum]CUV24381.1 conserved protein of unknown function [Ralstonia solanacearum]CUV37292.1 conserved protein of unknown function [Ralstonia solanacearum]